MQRRMWDLARQCGDYAAQQVCTAGCGAAADKGALPTLLRRPQASGTLLAAMASQLAALGSRICSALQAVPPSSRSVSRAYETTWQEPHSACQQGCCCVSCALIMLLRCSFPRRTGALRVRDHLKGAPGAHAQGTVMSRVPHASHHAAVPTHLRQGMRGAMITSVIVQAATPWPSVHDDAGRRLLYGPPSSRGRVESCCAVRHWNATVAASVH